MLVSFAAAACGSSSNDASPIVATSPKPSPGTAVGVHVAVAAVPGAGSVLVGPDGRTLYYLSTESSTSITCTGACATSWPPLLVAGGGNASLPSGVSGSITTVTRPDGTTQVSYNGHPLYYFAGDSAPGQDNGQGLGGTWFVLKPSGASGASNSTTTTAAHKGGYGY